MLCRNTDADETVKRHIDLLHEFNEVKDVAMGLLGMVAENRGVRLQDIMEGMWLSEQWLKSGSLTNTEFGVNDLEH